MMTFQAFCNILDKVFTIKKLENTFNKYSKNFKVSANNKIE